MQQVSVHVISKVKSKAETRFILFSNNLFDKVSIAWRKVYVNKVGKRFFAVLFWIGKWGGSAAANRKSTKPIGGTRVLAYGENSSPRRW